MSMNAAAAAGPAMTPEQEAAHKLGLAQVYAADAQRAVEAIEAKIAGMQASLKAAKAEAKRLRAEADRSAE